MLQILPEPSDSQPLIDSLLDRVFGAGRKAKTAERLREYRLPASGLSFVAHLGNQLVGTIRFWHIRIGARTPALLLGPLAVQPDLHDQGVGGELIRCGLNAARNKGHCAVILVGDEPYYQRFGFSAALTGAMDMPGPVDRRRLLGLELQPGGLAKAAGLILATGLLDPDRVLLRRAA